MFNGVLALLMVSMLLDQVNVHFNPGIFIKIQSAPMAWRGPRRCWKSINTLQIPLQIFGTFILKLYVEFLFATIMFIKINANGQVHPKSNTIQKDS
jgi:hypothetical protein